MELEQRRSPRLATSMPVGLRFPEGPFPEGWGRVLNLSPEGMLIETRFPLKVARVVYLTFSLKGDLQFENLRARVIRVSQDDGYFVAGIAFDDVVDLQTLREVIVAIAHEGGVTLS